MCDDCGNGHTAQCCINKHSWLIVLHRSRTLAKRLPATAALSVCARSVALGGVHCSCGSNISYKKGKWFSFDFAAVNLTECSYNIVVCVVINIK